VRRARSVLALGCLAVAGCSSASTAPGPAGRLAASAASGTIRLTNRAARPAFTFVVGRGVAAVVDWGPCVDAARCPPIPPGETRRVPYPGGLVGPDEREALVYWWHAVGGPEGAPRVDSIRVIVVRL
jgi:hypothetical protein